MSNNKKRLDENQLSIFDFSARIDEYVSLKEEILSQKNESDSNDKVHSWEEDCISLAAALKAQVDESGLSRDTIVDRLNAYYGWPLADEFEELKKAKKIKGVKHLSIHMFNHFLSKPTEYIIPGYYLLALQHITQSLKVCEYMAGEGDAQVISGDEKRALTLGKLDETILEMQRLKKELRGKK